MFTGVFAVWNAKTELEVKSLQRPVTEKMAFNHSEFIDRLITNDEFNPERKNSITFISGEAEKLNLNYVAPTVFSFKN